MRTPEEFTEEVFAAHEGGKLSLTPTARIDNADDLAHVYTPGVAQVCTAIAEKPELARHYTVKSNTVAVVTDGTAVLGLGNIGALASLPVMEGKAALFQRFAGVDAWPVPLSTTDVDDIVKIVEAIAPAYAGINLEDISAPRCFEIEARLREKLDIPVFHDDQHGTAVVCLAALINALRVVGKSPENVRVVVNGVGAAGVSIIRLLSLYGVRDIIGVDRQGALGVFTEETVANQGQEWVRKHTNPHGISGDIHEVIRDADVFIGVSGPHVIDATDVASMASNPIIFAMANPVPEIDPSVARGIARIVATGRSDYPNQINNVLVFPGLFRGLLDAHATTIDDGMLLAVANALAGLIDNPTEDNVIVSAFDERVGRSVAKAVVDYVDKMKDK
ncbi:NADP-dependent malic enzyme [Actinotignum urinale]|uniref:NAD(P)-dependent malic enzyme n=1 Tax=Actinotignum urinale TaxID=190146 RepID=UPI0003B610B7|nr:NADP-dependent malic enzyme [Actinotignum urinale]MDY5151656.1 NADP-dependent malic enzyme [Actinotignum urinale]MDY5160944.1 NADP-dependent malic enzyme [Actinotignum urinale]WIK59336.1 NADP-dependent malic enzyme [Actinotignum urinale]